MIFTRYFYCFDLLKFHQIEDIFESYFSLKYVDVNAELECSFARFLC